MAGAALLAPGVELGEQRRVDRVERRPTGDRHQRLESDRFAARLDAALVVALARPAKAGLHEIMRGQRREAIREGPLAADQDPTDGRAQIVIGQPRRDAQMREGPDMAVEKADLVLARVDPAKVAAGIHQAQQKQPRFAPHAGEVDQDLEEIHFRQLAGPIRQRNHDLAPLALPLGHRVFDQRHADPMAFFHQQLVQPRRGQPLLAARPVLRAGQQRLNPRPHLRPRPAARAVPPPGGSGPPGPGTCVP